MELPVADPSSQLAEDAPSWYVRERALAAVARNLAPAPIWNNAAPISGDG